MPEPDREEELRFREQINYRAELLKEISDLNKAIKSGGDGSIEMMTLMSDLTEEIRESIDHKINAINEQLQKETSMIEKTVFPIGWSAAHKQQVIEMQCKHLNVVANLHIKNVILNRMNDLDLLMAKGAVPEHGYMSLYTEDSEAEA